MQMAEYFCNSVGVLQQDSEATGAADGKLADKCRVVVMFPVWLSTSDGQDGAGGSGSGTSSEGKQSVTFGTSNYQGYTWV